MERNKSVQSFINDLGNQQNNLMESVQTYLLRCIILGQKVYDSKFVLELSIFALPEVILLLVVIR